MITTMIWACSKADASMVHHPQVQVQVQVIIRTEAYTYTGLETNVALKRTMTNQA